MTETTEVQKQAEKEERVYVKYTFFKAAREWRSLDDEAKEKAREEFLKVLEDHSSRMDIHCYSLVGIRGDTDFMIWTISRSLEDVQSLISKVNSTTLGRFIDVPYSYLAMTKRSTYLGGHKHPGQEGSGVQSVTSKFLFVYPFVKKREWYRLPFVERQRMMGEHFKVGHKYPGIKIHTGYSFGLDDQEFMLAFEGDVPSDFLDLVEELRGSDQSAYTQLETPIFTCVATDPKQMLEMIG